MIVSYRSLYCPPSSPLARFPPRSSAEGPEGAPGIPCPIMPIIIGLPPPPKKLGFCVREEGGLAGRSTLDALLVNSQNGPGHHLPSCSSLLLRHGLAHRSLRAYHLASHCRRRLPLHPSLTPTKVLTNAMPCPMLTSCRRKRRMARTCSVKISKSESLSRLVHLLRDRGLLAPLEHLYCAFGNK